MRSVAVSIVALAWLAAAPAARADTVRVAVVVGNNAGGGAQAPLRFAETDAGKMARVLVDLGGVAPADLFLLQGRRLPDLRAALGLATRRVALHAADPTRRVVVIFYFSGHSDGHALEIERDRLLFSDLKRWLGATGADVRVAIVDTCKSGGLLLSKGGKPGPSFQIRLSDHLQSTGDAILTSSAADENALESSEIGGSFFTHHLVSGLRGAADRSGDGRVTLSEAYEYAHARTLAATGETVAGPQHPTYDFRLSGQGELLLTELHLPSATIELPSGFERALVIESLRDQVIGELRAGDPAVVAVRPGSYSVRIWRRGRASVGRVSVGRDQKRRISWHDLAPVRGSSQAKGGPAAALSAGPVVRRGGPRAPAIMAGLGARHGGAGDGLGASGTARLAVSWRSGPTVSLIAGTGTGRGARGGFRESSGVALVGYRLSRSWGRLGLSTGLELGAGLVVQTPRAGDSRRSATAGAAPVVGLALRLTDAIELAVDGHLLLGVLERDGAAELITQPAGWLGLRFHL